MDTATHRTAFRIVPAVATTVVCLAAALAPIGCGAGADGPAAETAQLQDTAGPALARTIEATVADQLEPANIAFNTPASVRLDDAAVIELRLSHERSIAELQEELTAIGDRAGAVVQASEVMLADLTGVDFRIEEITPARQAVWNDVTEWRWEIEPTEVGRRRLHLTLTALVTFNGTETASRVETFERTLEVEGVPVAWHEPVTGFIGGNWQFLLGSLLIPLAGWALKRRSDAAKTERRAGHRPAPVGLQRGPHMTRSRRRGD